MALETFFEINLPYCVSRHATKKDHWVCSNREYHVIGTIHEDFELRNLPEKYYIRYKGLDEEAILKIMGKDIDQISRNDEGEIVRFYLHRSINKNFDSYLKRLEMLFNFKSR